MVARATCRERFARFGAAFALSCVVTMTLAAPAAAQVQGPPAPPPPRDAESAAANAKELVDPIRRCKPAEDGSINVCGTDTERHRLTPELRAIANEGREAPPKLPRAEARAMTLDKLPYNWISIGGRMKPGPEYNALYEMAKERTDPETGDPPPAEEEP
ncbi:hypothetical protein E5675_19660 [Sphingopyxis sp. PAMC25046]|nr:hypothetical protein E5675_19660 [Sphingopyxis sp. PAMC25046]